MEVRGFANHRFFGMSYLHRAVNSSVRNLRKDGIDPNALWRRRQEHVVRKWAGVSPIAEGPLNLVRQVTFRL